MNPYKDHVIVVNEKDEWMGTIDKMKAHQEGILHRAFSVFIINNKNELLLQQRAADKYHSGGLWSNTCCSHPAPGESTLAAAHRRLNEEMGFDCELESLFSLRYKSEVGNQLIENEFDYIYIGRYNGIVTINTEEAKDYAFVSAEKIKEMIAESPEIFTAWFKLAIPKFLERLQQYNNAA